MDVSNIENPLTRLHRHGPKQILLLTEPVASVNREVPRLMGDGQPQPKSCSLSLAFTNRIDCAAMQLHKPFHNRKPQAQPAIPASRRGVCLVEKVQT